MTISNFITQFPYPGMFILLILVGLGLPFPEDAILILCGLLISSGVIRLMPALMTVYSGLLIADLTLHMIHGIGGLGGPDCAGRPHPASFFLRAGPAAL